MGGSGSKAAPAVARSAKAAAAATTRTFPKGGAQGFAAAMDDANAMPAPMPAPAPSASPRSNPSGARGADADQMARLLLHTDDAAAESGERTRFASMMEQLTVTSTDPVVDRTRPVTSSRSMPSRRDTTQDVADVLEPSAGSLTTEQVELMLSAHASDPGKYSVEHLASKSGLPEADMANILKYFTLGGNLPAHIRAE